MIPRSSTPPRKNYLPKSSRGVRKVNPKRRAKEWPRTFGSLERVLWVKALPCAGCGRTYPMSANAHTENEGKSRKGHYSTIAPLCIDLPSIGYIGCHTKYDQHLAPFDTEEGRARIKVAAVETQKHWLFESGEIA